MHYPGNLVYGSVQLLVPFLVAYGHGQYLLEGFRALPDGLECYIVPAVFYFPEKQHCAVFPGYRCFCTADRLVHFPVRPEAGRFRIRN